MFDANMLIHSSPIKSNFWSALLLPSIIALLGGVGLPSVGLQTGTLTGFVRDPNKEAVYWARVFVKSGSTQQSVKTDADGKYRIELDEGKYSVDVRADGFLPSKTIRTEVAAGVTTRCDIDLFIQETQSPHPGIVPSRESGTPDDGSSKARTKRHTVP
jgi:hypothetical protein